MARQRRLARETEPADSSGNVDTYSSKGPKKKQAKRKWDTKFTLFVFFNIGLVLLIIGYMLYSTYLENIVVTPLNVPNVIISSGLSVPDRFWGSYRTGLYFGMQTRSPQFLATGLMWFQQKIVDNSIQVRHWCSQSDGLKQYGWLQHDGVNFGVQNITDGNVLITTSFVKRLGGNNGGDWTARLSVKPQVPENGVATVVPMSLLFYVATNGDGSISPQVIENSHLKAIHGSTKELGRFTVSFLPGASSKSNAISYNFLSTHAPPGLHILKETVLHNLAHFQPSKGDLHILGLIGASEMDGELKNKQFNFLVHQVTFFPPFEMEAAFESDSFTERPNQLTGMVFDRELDMHVATFQERFENVFHLSRKGYSLKEIQVAQAIFSNLVGGIGYFYGASLVQSDHNKEPVEYWKAPLYTAVPSRSFFPRGFLWDEGFHNMLLSRWNPDITKDILGHWLDLMNSEGWIPREQILGSDARARVPQAFIVQRNTIANPPTLFLSLESLLRQMENQKIPEDIEFFRRAFPRLQALFRWFNTTQLGKVSGSYRWRGRDSKTDKELNPKTLASGLDDYPRASHPTDDERHVDLHCWMAFAAGIMARIAEKLREPWQEYEATSHYLSGEKLLDDLYWSPTSQMYSDFGFHTTGVKLVRPKVVSQPGMPPPHVDRIRVVMQEPTLKFVDTFGYISLFPFLLQIMKPDSPKLHKVLVDMRDPKLLWTNYGLRSLAKNAPLYLKYNTENDPPYWRGPIWINMNFLAVRALYHYSQHPGPYQDEAQKVYRDLRQNVISNIIKEYLRTGYVWETYNDKTGYGQGSHPFTGWTALVVAMMAELY